MRSNVYCEWLRDSMGMQKARIKGDTLRESGRAKVEALKHEAGRQQGESNA